MSEEHVDLLFDLIELRGPHARDGEIMIRMKADDETVCMLSVNEAIDVIRMLGMFVREARKRMV